MTICDLSDFFEAWSIDYEYYPGRGLANGGVEGDPITPLCLVAHEMRSGRTIRLWQDEFWPFPPYRLDAGALIVSYGLAAEFGCHIALGWGEPACALDALVEFRHHINDGKDRDRSLSGALNFFRLENLDVTRKEATRKRIMQGPPFSDQERREILDYCEDDVRALTRLFPRLVRTIWSWPHALHRARVQWPFAKIEHRGVPTDLPTLSPLRTHWDGMRVDLVGAYDAHGIYEIKNGVPHFRMNRFEAFLARNHIDWPRLPSGTLNTESDTFRDMAMIYPELNSLRELRASLSELKLNNLAVGVDGRNRTPLWAYSTKTARCAPSNAKYVFGPAKWIRFLVMPPPGLALVHRDFKQQEVRIAALMAGDHALLDACESGDIYLGIAGQIGLLRESMDVLERKRVRDLAKVIVLAIQYGAGAASLAMRAGMSKAEARESLARLHARFPYLQEFALRVGDRAGLLGSLTTCYRWRLKCPPETNPRTIRNFPIQSAGSMILHVLCLLAEKQGIPLVATIHDAVIAEGDPRTIEDVRDALDHAMRDASAMVLRGYELPSDYKILLPGDRYVEERGQSMWDTVTSLLAKRQRETA